MRACGKWLVIFACVPVIVVAAYAADAMQSKTVGDYRVELHVLPAEPFFSKADIAARNIKEGMEIEGGAPPVPPDADSHPNHHLVIHVFDKKTSKAVTDATVTMNFVALDAKAKPIGAPSEVPVVVMQAVGKGPASTHYGNNVTMPTGRYDVTVTVNGKKAEFNVTASDAPAMSMEHMKM
jgi:hypothetical protein